MAATDDPLLSWLTDLGLARHAQVLADNDISFALLTDLGDADFRELGISIGDRKRLLNGIAVLKATDAPTPGLAIIDQAQRRQLTVMFCDLVGSTRLAEQLDPEDLRRLTHSYQDLCEQVVSHYEGLIARLIGDGMLIYFGFPQAHEDDAERAILAGQTIVSRLAEIPVATGSEPLRVRIGIATGMVVVADPDTRDLARRGDVFGTTPNLAARLQDLAEPNSIVVAARTRQLTSGRFSWQDLGRHRLKGFSEPIQVWQVVARRRLSSRFAGRPGHGNGGHLGALIGRNEIQQQLQKLWQQACQGHGQVAILHGEAGIGKSRLLRSLDDWLTTQPHYQLLNQCSPFKTRSAFFPVIFELERLADIQPQDDDQQKLAKLQSLDAFTDSGHSGHIEVLTLIGTLLSIAMPDSGLPAQAPELLKHRITEALLDRVRYLSERQPVLYLVEDAHWIDPSTLGLLQTLMGRLGGQRVLLLITTRPGFEPEWPDADDSESVATVSQLELAKLPPADAQALIQQLSGQHQLPPEVSQPIIERAGGNPLFIEELTRLVLDSGLLERQGEHYRLQGGLSRLAIPATLHDSLMARIDKLSAVRETTQIAALLGPDFNTSLLTAVSNADPALLDRHLKRLLDAGLLLHSGEGQHRRYRFKHPLVQEAAYQSLLKSRRKTLHARAADALQATAHLYPPSPELLAWHCGGATRFERAAPHWQRAAEVALAQSAYIEAIACLRAGLDAIEQLADNSERDALEFRQRALLGIALTAAHGYGLPDARDSYSRAAKLAGKLGQDESLFAALYGLWSTTLLRSDYRNSRELAEQLLTDAEQSGLPAWRLCAHRALGTSLFYSGELQAAAVQQQRGLDIAIDAEIRQQAMQLDPADPWVTLHCYQSVTLWLLGRTEQAEQARQTAVDIATRLRHPYSLALALGLSAWLCQFRGERLQTLQFAERTAVLARRHRLPFWIGWGTVLAGWAGEDRNPQTRIDNIIAGLQHWRGLKADPTLVYYNYLLADAQRDAGQTTQALQTVDTGLQSAADSNEHWWTAELQRLRGDLLLTLYPRHPERAEHAYREALAAAGAHAADALLLRATVSLATLLIDRDRHADARQLLDQALALDIPQHPQLETARALLAGLDSSP